MKRSRLLFSTLCAAALAGLVFTGCDKKRPDQPAPPQAADATTPGSTQPGEPARPVLSPTGDATKPSGQPPVAAADVAKIAPTYGFVARLPKDVEGFSGSYHLHELWTGLANSKWTATLLELPPVKENPDFTRLREQWNSEQGQQMREIFHGFFGNEAVVAMPAGFTAKLEPWVELFTKYQQTMMQAYFMMAMSGGSPSPEKMQQMIKDAAPEFIPALSRCEMPPLIFAFKAASVRPMVDSFTKQIVSMVGSELPPAFEPGTFKLAEKYDFQSISVDAKKLVAQFQEVKLELQLRELLGDDAKAKEAMDALISKRAEIAWGWVEDYFVVSVGSNHDHLKLAPADAESALGIAEVGRRAAQFAGNRPHGLSYLSKLTFDTLQGDMKFAEQFKAFAEELQGILKPEQIDAMVADVRRLEGKAIALFKNEYTSLVQVDLWEGGMRSELFGGAKHKAFDSSKPLTFSSLGNAATFLLCDGRANAAYSKATADFVEDAATTLWSWYEKNGREMVPEDQRQGAAMIEAMAKPMIVDFWKASRRLAAGLGEESALIVDLNGPMPKIPDLPPFLANGKVPRIAWVAELKDRAAVSDAWKGYSALIKQIAAMADQDPKIAEAQMKQEGDVELHFIPLPVPTDDLLPHVAISKDRWMISTSPSFTKEITGKPATPTGMAVGSHWNINFSALYDYADGWLKVVDQNGSQMMSPAEFEQYQQTRPLFDAGLKLGRSVQGFEWHLHEEDGLPRHSVRLKMQDLQ